MSFVLYRSSAGSGKTYTLVKEYLKLVLENPEKFKNILAVTFTNKAASEMKERILLALKKLAKGEDPNLAKTLAESLPATKNIATSSAQLQTRLLHNYSDFAILTIDSFIHKVLRAFALETGLPLSFSIELNYERLYSYVVERLISHVGRNEHITRIILEFVDDRIKEGKNWNIEKAIKNFVGELFKEKNADWAKEIHRLGPDMYQNYKEQLGSRRDDFLHKMKEFGIKASQMIQEANLTVDDFSYGKNGAAGFFEKIARLKESGLNDFKINSYLEKENWYTKKAPANITAHIDFLRSTGLDDIRQQVIDLFNADYRSALTAHYMLENFYLSAIIGEIKQLIEEYKQRNNVVPISEFNIKVYEIVSESPVPFIYEMLGEKFTHYLIDEFQDTSKMQWRNLYPLIDNSLASGYFNLAVGDGKQSIYRWRGGDVEIMESEIRQGPLQIHLQEKTLDHNFRSRANVVHFNNHFFTDISETYKGKNTMLESIYRDIAQKPAAQPDGLVSLQLIPETAKSTDADPLVFEKVNAIIRECLNTGKYDEGDIAILVRAKKEGKKIAENLMNQPENFKVVSPDSLVLANIPLIRFLVDILTFLDNPKDPISRAAIIYYLCLHRHTNPFPPATIGQFFGQNADLFLDQYPQLKTFFMAREFLIRLPVYEVIEEVIRIFQLQQTLDFKTEAYLQAFLNIVSNYSAENNVDFSSFLDWWDSNEEEFALEVPENAKAIKIMTIHKAKGLEFPIVIIPYANWTHNLDDPLWLQADPEEFTLDPPLEIPMPIKRRKKLAESCFEKEYRAEKVKVEIDNINLLYVAFTRAVDQLHIIAHAQKQSSHSGSDDTNESSYTNVQLLLELAAPRLQKLAGEEEHYILGVATVKEDPVKKDSEIEYRRAEELISSQWYKKITIRRKAIEFWRFDTHYTQDKKRWGLLVHKVLAAVKSCDDVPVVVASLLNAGEIEAMEQPLLIEKISTLFANETVKEWFNPQHQVFTESPIITDRGVLRPDRVIVTADRVILVDFKTGEKNPVHTHQLLQYQEALFGMGYHTVEAYLLYLDNALIQNVTLSPPQTKNEKKL